MDPDSTSRSHIVLVDPDMINGSPQSLPGRKRCSDGCFLRLETQSDPLFPLQPSAGRLDNPPPPPLPAAGRHGYQALALQPPVNTPTGDDVILLNCHEVMAKTYPHLIELTLLSRVGVCCQK